MRARSGATRTWRWLLVLVSVLEPSRAAAGPVPTPSPSAAPPAFEGWWPEVAARLDRGVVTGNAEDYREARTLGLRGLATPLQPEQVVSTRYAVAYADWRLVRLPG